MIADRQTADSSRTPSAWVRWVAICSLLLLLVSTGAGATHLHDGLLGTSAHPVIGKAAVSGTLDTEANCPLCASFHAAMPVVLQSSFDAPRLFAEAIQTRLGSIVPTALHFALFTRPPPVSA